MVQRRGDPLAAAPAISYLPLTAPVAMPGRIAMGAADWWEPVTAALLTLATIVGLVLLVAARPR